MLNSVTPSSLVLIDELGRATSTSDGIGIAWAVAERLIAVGAATLFATHFAELGRLAALYPSCKAWHFDVAASDRLVFTWQLMPGHNSDAHYGLMLGPLVPPDLTLPLRPVHKDVSKRNCRLRRLVRDALSRGKEGLFPSL